jgi:hypothetical protein
MLDLYIEHAIHENITWHIKMSYTSFSQMQGRPAWISLWRQLLPRRKFLTTITFPKFKCIPQNQKLSQPWKKCHISMWCFHKYYVIHVITLTRLENLCKPELLFGSTNFWTKLRSIWFFLGMKVFAWCIYTLMVSRTKMLSNTCTLLLSKYVTSSL